MLNNLFILLFAGNICYLEATVTVANRNDGKVKCVSGQPLKIWYRSKQTDNLLGHMHKFLRLYSMLHRSCIFMFFFCVLTVVWMIGW